jgi:hypothetical protein
MLAYWGNGVAKSVCHSEQRSLQVSQHRCPAEQISAAFSLSGVLD